jgi:hypothetical protein
MNKALTFFRDLLLVTVLTFVLASAFHSQVVLFELIDLGVVINLTDRLSMTIDDIVGLLPTYGVVLLISLLLAFLVGRKLCVYTKLSETIIYPLAGSLGIAAALLAMPPILNITLLAGSRTAAGFISQCLAGAIGGWCFAKIHMGQSAQS